MALDELRVAALPGTGLVARFPGVILLVVGESSGPAAAALVDACREQPGVTARLRAIGSSRTGGPAFFALVEEEGRILSLTAGILKVSIESVGSKLEFASTDAAGWNEEAVRGQLRSVVVAEKAVRAGTQPLADLIQGVATGGGVEVVDRAAAPAAAAAASQTAAPPPPPLAPAPPPAAAAPPSPAPTPPPPAAAPPPQAAAPPPPAPAPPPPAATAPNVGSETLIMAPPGQVAPGPPPGELNLDQQATLAAATAMSRSGQVVNIEGHECAKGHLNDPLAPTCRVCGEPVLEKVGHGPRPPLGRLVGKNGYAVVVDRDFIIGRKPEDAPEVIAGVYDKIAVPADQSGVSRIHAEIRISQWSVLLTDRRSVNGTYLRPAGLTEWIKLEPGHTVQLVPGSGIAIGGYELTFEPIQA